MTPKILSKKTAMAIQFARRPGGASAGELAKAMSVPSCVASGYLMSASLYHGIHRALTHSNSRAFRYFGTLEEASAHGLSAPVEEIGKSQQGMLISKTKVDKTKLADTSRAVRTVAAPFVDKRFHVELPAGYVSHLNPAECRPWAAAL